MPTQTNDFLATVDFTGATYLAQSDLDLLVNEAQVQSDRGLVVWTTDVAGAPTLPTITGNLSRVTRYIWARLGAASVKLYVYRAAETSDAIFDKWREITANYTATNVGPAALQATVAGFGLQYSSTAGLSVKLSVTNVAALRALVASGITDGTLCYVSGYATTGDGGGGWFIKKTGSVVDNAGQYVVYSPGGVTSTSYWERILSLEDAKFGEYFGAKGDGTTDDTLALRACMLAYNRLDLKEATYRIQGVSSEAPFAGLPVRSSGLILRGAGIDKSILKLIDNCVGAATSSNWFAMIQNYDYPGSVDDCYFADFTVDCNFDGQATKQATLAGINITGAHNVAERVKIIGQGAGVTQFESFGILFTKQSGTTDTRGSRISYCEATLPGSRAGAIAEISPFVISSAEGNPPNYDDLQYGPVIEFCKVYEFHGSDQRTSTIHAVSMSGAIGGILRGNIVTNVDGTGIYLQDRHNIGLVIEDNTLWNVLTGIELISSSAYYPIVDNGCLYSKCVFRNNHIKLIESYDPTWSIPHPAMGIVLNVAGYKDNTGTIYNSYDSLIFEGNEIYGNSFLYNGNRSYPYGIFLQAATTYYSIVLKNNIIDIPDTYNDTVNYSFTNIPGENSIVIGLRSSYNSNGFQSYNNKSSAGVACRIKAWTVGNTYAVYTANNWYNYSTSSVPDEYPPNLQTLQYNQSTGQIFFPTKLITPITSGSIIEGKTYRVYSPSADAAAHIDYNSVSYYPAANPTFVGVNGVTTFGTGVDAVVYEDYPYFWKRLGQEKDLVRKVIAVTATAVVYALSLNTSDRELEGLVQVDFDNTATDKKLYLPNPAYFPGRTFRLIVSKAGSANTVTLYVGTDATPLTGLLITSASDQLVNNVQIIGTTAALSLVELECVSNGTYWFVNT